MTDHNLETIAQASAYLEQASALQGSERRHKLVRAKQLLEDAIEELWAKERA